MIKKGWHPPPGSGSGSSPLCQAPGQQLMGFFKVDFKKVPWKRSGGGQAWVPLRFVEADDALLGFPNLFCILLTISIVELSRMRINCHKRCSAALATSLEITPPE